MLPRNSHLLGKMRQRERGSPARESVLPIFPGNPIEDDRRELVRRRGERGFSNAAQDSARGEFHDVSFRLGTTPDREAYKFSFRQRHLPVERVQGSR